MIWRDVPVQHFATPKGAFDPAALGQHCQPLKPIYDVSAPNPGFGVLEPNA